MNQLEGLKQFTSVVADSGDIESIRHYAPQDATTNPSLILKAANLSCYKNLFESAIKYAKKQGGTHNTQLVNASDHLAVNIGVELLKNIPGRVSTEVDARLSFNRNLCVAKARKLISLYRDQKIDKARILIKIAATWEGVKAAEELEKEGINCNLTLVFSFAQARICAEAKVYLISPFVGRIYDWYSQRKSLKPYMVNEDPGVMSLKKIYNYYKQHCYQTVVMGASFRNIDQILALSGCDCLTITPPLLNLLQNTFGNVERKLSPLPKSLHQPSPMSESEFRWEHNQDAMAVEKVAEGIRQFAIDQESLENLIAKNL
ncbi:transaldolase [secondary endosymbiont of Heteropsylla cubana]|uniref:Transaldolase n=1 Tax=secondary endosymbiont of Heteropsylla cubana TaxID=134287 RepID=J3YSX1_9ENTR|nr:transaldolase [secondary endosymbiont of Heteropsylla cubana]AFP85428.1 transaldolase [secondary endosymbiont of Heteropsylla cubana]